MEFWKSKESNDHTPNKNDKLNYILNVHTPQNLEVGPTILGRVSQSWRHLECISWLKVLKSAATVSIGGE